MKFAVCEEKRSAWEALNITSQTDRKRTRRPMFRTTESALSYDMALTDRIKQQLARPGVSTATCTTWMPADLPGFFPSSFSLCFAPFRLSPCPCLTL